MAKLTVSKAVIVYREAAKTAIKVDEERRLTSAAAEEASRAYHQANHDLDVAHSDLIQAITESK